MTNAMTVIGYCLLVIGMTSCGDMLETESELVEYEKDNTLNHPTDSVYSVLGIINKMQIIADRTVILGEARSDLMTVTDAASSDLKRLASFSLNSQPSTLNSQPSTLNSNKYNKIADYYAVINNCNYFLAHIDTTMQRRGRQLFRNEYAAVKSFRAWTYLELVKIYGEVPLVTTPLMTEREAHAALNSQLSSIKDVCNYFIEDLTPYAYVNPPVYGSIGKRSSTKFFIPTRALLGDLCLWAGRYEEAAKWYSDYLNDKIAPIKISSSNRVHWSTPMIYTSPSGSYSVTGDNEVLGIIPMETDIFDGNISDIDNIMNSTRENNYFYQLQPTVTMRQLSARQINCLEYSNEQTRQVIYVNDLSEQILTGDLRLYSVYSLRSRGTQDPYEEYSSLTQQIDKFTRGSITTYRSPMVYLRFAEALNRSGYPQSAFLILKHGLCPENVELFVDSIERSKAGQLIMFDPLAFPRLDEQGNLAILGIHSRGSGDSHCNDYYVLPQPEKQLATREDTVQYQIPLVEDMIIEEMALEGFFEGYRYYDLMRVALRRNDPDYLAGPISRRNGEQDNVLHALLMDQKNWYLPKQ